MTTTCTERCCTVGPWKSSRHNGTYRLEAMVDGHSVWFESADVPLRPSAEALASSFLIPALHHGWPMRIHAPLSPLWRENTGKLLRVLHEWWDYPNTLPIESRGDAFVAERRPEKGQCFSGGADSFYSLLRGRHPTRNLVFVHGFDVSYRDGYRMRQCRQSLAAVAEAVEKRLIVVRTNLRKHPLFASVSWERTHGAALASIGHLLSDAIGGLVIPSSYPYDDSHPWGSHWISDPLWSSEAMEIIHDDAEFYRLDKLKRIDREPLVQRHLRVCWENLATSGNCSRCDKCIRTMIVLFMRGQLQQYPVFDRQTPIPAILDRMDPVPEVLHRRYEDLIEEGLPQDIEAAVRRLLERRGPGRFFTVRRALRKSKLAMARICG